METPREADEGKRMSGGRLGGRAPGELPEAGTETDDLGKLGALAAFAALVLAGRALLGGPSEQYYVFTSSSTSVTVLDESGRPRTEEQKSSSFRTNVPGLTQPNDDLRIFPF